MGLSSINPLMQAEMLLYGGASGFDPNCPSYTNGYFARNLSNYGGMYPYGYNSSYNPIMFQGNSPYVNNYYGRAGYSGGIGGQQTNSVGFGATQADLDALGDYYLKGLAPSETIGGAALSGVMFKMLEHPRIVVHPWNSYTATKSTDAIFADVKKEGTKLYELWNSPEKSKIIREAYARTHKLEAIKNSKLGLFRSSISPDSELYKNLLKEMKEALAFAGPEKEKLEKIALATEKIKKATNAFTGYIPRGFRAIKLQKPMTALRKWINSSQYTPAEEVVAKQMAEKTGEFSLRNSLKKSCGLKGGLFFAAMEFLTSYENIKEAFSKDSSTGWTQVGQTAVKGVGSAVGWAVGEGIGVWAGAKLGMKVGSRISPGLGTVIGAIAGMVGGSIGMMLTGRVTHAIVGQDIGEKVKLENMKKTPEGQKQLLSMTLEQAQKDKNLDMRTAQALQHLAGVYGNA